MPAVCLVLLEVWGLLAGHMSCLPQGLSSGCQFLEQKNSKAGVGLRGRKRKKLKEEKLQKLPTEDSRERIWQPWGLCGGPAARRFCILLVMGAYSHFLVTSAVGGDHVAGIHQWDLTEDIGDTFRSDTPPNT